MDSASGLLGCEVLKLSLQRESTLPNGCTYGKLTIDGRYFCETLEDAIREREFVPVSEWKIQNQTAIPAGTYTVIIDFSGRFKRLMPHIIGVPGFEGVRIHSGNTTADTDGCPMVGFARRIKELPLTNSRAAFESLFDQMKAVVAEDQKISISILNPLNNVGRTL